MRWTGYLMIFLAASGGGFYASLLLDKRKRQLLGLRRVVVSLKREIDYQLSTIAEALLHTAERAEEPWSDFLKETGIQLQENRNSGEEFETLWNIQVEKAESFHPWKKDLDILKDLGRGLGQLDKEMQMSQLQLTEEELLEAEKTAEEEKKKKGHLYRMLGVCMGILGIVMLL